METKNILEGDELKNFFDSTEPIKGVETTVVEQAEIKDFFKPEESNITKEEVIPHTSQNHSTSFYDDLVLDMIKEGDWIDGEVELEDGSSVMLSEMKGVSAEVFKQIKENQKQLQKEEFNKKYISVDGLDETTKKMIELKKAGGDITTILQYEAQVVNPLKGLDLDDDRIQAELVAQKYFNMGLDQDTIDFKIKKLIKDNQLDTEAHKIISEVNKNYDAYVESEKNKQLEIRNAQIEEQKVFKKSITEVVKNLGIEKESVTKKLIDTITKTDDNGLAELDKLYFESKKDPEKHSKLALFLADTDTFYKIITHKTKLETTKGDVNKLFKISAKASNTPTNTTNNPLEEFFNK